MLENRDHISLVGNNLLKIRAKRGIRIPNALAGGGFQDRWKSRPASLHCQPSRTKPHVPKVHDSLHLGRTQRAQDPHLVEFMILP